MSKAFVMRAGKTAFLVEADETIVLQSVQRSSSVESSQEVSPSVTSDEPIMDNGIPLGMIPVVSISDVEKSLSEVTKVIVACCIELHAAIASIPNPDKMTVEFGVKIAGESGIPMLTKASGEANFKVTVAWGK